MSWRHSSEASFNASRTRCQAPSARQLARADARHQGCYLFRRQTRRDVKWDVWDSVEQDWTWHYTEELARRRIDQRRAAAAVLAARFPAPEGHA